MTEGIYGQCLPWLLEVISVLEGQHATFTPSSVEFDINTLNNGRLVPRFIVPRHVVRASNATTIDIDVAKYKRSKKFPQRVFPLEDASFAKASDIFHRYFKVSDDVQAIVDKYPTAGLGVHYRGTDKNHDRSQANPITETEMLTLVSDYVQAHPDVDCIICCSDEASFIRRMRDTFPGKRISHHTQPLNDCPGSRLAWFRQGQRASACEQEAMTIGSIVDMLLLAKCKVVLKTSSALSSFAKIINPQVVLRSVSAMKRPWFPAAGTYRYQAHGQDAKAILQRTLQGDRGHSE
jgi:hypothetical protein